MTTKIDLLKPGDRVDIIAASSKCDMSLVPKVKQLVESWGLECHLSEDLFGPHPLCANVDEIRLKNLVNALNSPAKLIWSIRGGYGATRILPDLKNLAPPKIPKLFLGFSDVTALHIFFNQHWDWPSIHGPGASQAASGKVKSSVAKLKALLFGESPFTEALLEPMNEAAKVEASLEAPVVGGNLTVLEAGLGTFWQANTRGAILFLEEINERAYRIDRSLVHFKQAGLFDEVEAIVFGDFVGGDEADGRNLIASTLMQFAGEIKVPVFKTQGIGHGDVNDPLVLGGKALLQLGNKPRLTTALP